MQSDYLRENSTRRDLRELVFLAGGGEMGARMRAFEWERTPLGPPESWPQSLKTIVRVMLDSRYAMWMLWGPDLTFFCNDAYLPTVGLKRDWVLGARSDKVWEEIWPDVSPRIAKVLQHGEATWDEALLLFLERKGFVEESYHTFSYSPIYDDESRIAGMLCVVTEVTERIQSERQLNLLRDLAARGSGIQDVRECCRRCKEVLSLYPSVIPLLGLYLRDEANNQLNLVVHSERGDQQQLPQHLSIDSTDSPWPVASVMSGQTVHIVDLEQLGLSVPAYPWIDRVKEGRLLPLKGAGQNQPAGLLLLGASPRRVFNDEYGDFLDLVATQIASAIADAQAYAAERQRVQALAELDRAKTTFFSNVSHEFRTPLTLMLGPIDDALSLHETSPSVRTHLEVAHRNAQRLLKLVNSLLDFSRIEAGRVQASLAPVDLAALTADLSSTFRSAMERAKLEFIVDCRPLGESVYVDREMWEKIVLNLLSNAFKFTLAGSVRVGIARVEGKAVLEVSDTGVGVPDHEIPRLFDRFHRVEGAKARTHEGSGIGLALVHELVKLHGGSIDVRSRVGAGTAFRVSLPLGNAHVPSERIDENPSPDSHAQDGNVYVQEALRWLPNSESNAGVVMPTIGEPTNDSRFAALFGSRILLADDNADMRDYIRDLLSTLYEVETVADGGDALRAARRKRPDLILSDVMMPKLDGFGLLSALREDKELRDVPVVLLSARAGEESRIEGLGAGADDYIVKPFHARELLARVGALLELTKLRREADETVREERRSLEILNRAGTALAMEMDLHRLVQIVTDAGVELSGAQFGAFFYNLEDERGESYMLYTLSGAPAEAFSKFPMPRNTKVFAPTFSGEGIVRSDDITKDPRYGHNAPRKGMPEGHLPVRSYLAVPVMSRAGKVLGGLFFGHAEVGVFSDRSERGMSGLAAQAAVAIDNVNLAQAAQREIAERSRAQNALRDLNANLEREITERTEQLRKQEEALRQAQKMEAVGQLTGGVAHDFNNILQVIVGSLDVIRRLVPADSSRIQRAAESAMNGAKQASSLTQRLLAFSRRQPLDPRPLDVNSLVGGMSDLLNRSLGETISVETVRAAGLWKVEVDPNALESAILNLAVNARDAMPDGGRLTIETMNTHIDDIYAATHAEIVPGQYVAISVSDTGIGMSADTLSKAFEPFFTTKPVGKGTGLGLSQVYGFAKQSGGHVKIYSEEGEGTTVKIYLRRLDSVSDESIPQPSISVPEGTNEENILVVEDDANVRAYSVDALRELGYRVLEARDGASALRVLESGARIDLLFTDVVLPGGMTGDQIAAKACAMHPKLKVLFTTGYARNAIVHHGRLDKGVQLITKPFNFADLAAKVRDVLDGLAR